MRLAAAAPTAAPSAAACAGMPASDAASAASNAAVCDGITPDQHVVRGLGHGGIARGAGGDVDAGA